MNCSHSGDGWCLSCVKELYDEKESLKIFIKDIVIVNNCMNKALIESARVVKIIIAKEELI